MRSWRFLRRRTSARYSVLVTIVVVVFISGTAAAALLLFCMVVVGSPIAVVQINRARRHAEAIAPLRRALELHQDVAAERELAMAHDLLGRPDEARPHFAAAYAGAPGDRLTVFNFALFLRRHRELAQAREILDRHLRADPGDLDARRLRASLAPR